MTTIKEVVTVIGVDLAGILGGRMASAECGLVPRGFLLEPVTSPV